MRLKSMQNISIVWKIDFNTQVGWLLLTVNIVAPILKWNVKLHKTEWFYFFHHKGYICYRYVIHDIALYRTVWRQSLGVMDSLSHRLCWHQRSDWCCNTFNGFDDQGR